MIPGRFRALFARCFTDVIVKPQWDEARKGSRADELADDQAEAES